MSLFREGTTSCIIHQGMNQINKSKTIKKISIILPINEKKSFVQIRDDELRLSILTKIQY
jgi:hypothetical protein